MRTDASYRQPRRPVGYTYTFEHGFEVIEAVIHDLSRSGARIDGDFNFAGPDEITLLFYARRIPAKIIWMRFGTIGIAFDSPLDDSTYKTLLGHVYRKAASTPQWNAFGV